MLNPTTFTKAALSVLNAADFAPLQIGVLGHPGSSQIPRLIQRMISMADQLDMPCDYDHRTATLRLGLSTVRFFREDAPSQIRGHGLHLGWIVGVTPDGEAADILMRSTILEREDLGFPFVLHSEMAA